MVKIFLRDILRSYHVKINYESCFILVISGIFHVLQINRILEDLDSSIKVQGE